MLIHIPPDVHLCQALKPNGNTFMTLCGVPGYERCDNKPLFIATKKNADKDGHVGSMSLCEECRIVCEKQMPDAVIFSYIEVK